MIKKMAFVYLVHEEKLYLLGDGIVHSVQRRPQLGLQYLSAVLEKKGVKTDIFDQSVIPFDFDWLSGKLKEFDMVGFYCSDPQENKVKDYSRKIKERLGIPVLVGGPNTLTNSTFLEDGCDIVVHGEGEKTIQDIVDYYNGARSIDTIKGISYKKDGRVVKSAPQELIQNIDTIPFPDRSKVDINAYHDYFLFGMRKPYITMIASRGCAYKCFFCTSHKSWGNKYRRRSVDNVIAEIDEVIGKYGVKYIAFQDDIFGMTNDWIEEFCEKLIKRPYRVRWMAIFHPFSIRTDTERVFRLMKRAGCDILSFGLQAAHAEVLRGINRDPGEPEALKRLLKIANRIGFVTAVSYIFGLPGDTEDTIKKTISYSLNCGSTLANYFMLSILRGSELEGRYRDKRICELSDERIESLAEHASKAFYMRPGAILNIACFVLKNPRWLIEVGGNIPAILRRLSFGKSSRKKENVF
ncbi:MAG: B12-binding domain-containing radical SAM protein [Candidatus Omnitrophica bacterium]|nr:B12-binding domain-containing radical SAM protein [Candidatus Omnitrophota bacterium]